LNFLDKNWNDCPKEKSKYYRLIEYDKGESVGKVYDFYSSGKIQMVGEYENITSDIRTGTFIWFSKDGLRTSLTYYSADTLIEHSYYSNGNLMYNKLNLRGRDMFSYTNSYWYFKNGNPKWFNYHDSRQDTSYYLSGRKNGSIDFQDISSNGKYERIRQNRKGELTERSFRNTKSEPLKIQYFKNGKLIKTETPLPKNDTTKYIGKYIRVTYYQGQQVGGNSMVIIFENEGETEYNVNGDKLSELEYLEYKQKYSAFIDSRQPVHHYQEYSQDSILLFEGLFKKVDLPCGIYRSYYPNGAIKIRGWYDKKGRKSGVWYFYNDKGELLYTEYYKRGNKTKANK
jgi:antitoxin component YwqK of YwqJK toxin-antitoxin module